MVGDAAASARALAGPVVSIAQRYTGAVPT